MMKESMKGIGLHICVTALGRNRRRGMRLGRGGTQKTLRTLQMHVCHHTREVAYYCLRETGTRLSGP